MLEGINTEINRERSIKILLPPSIKNIYKNKKGEKRERENNHL